MKLKAPTALATIVLAVACSSCGDNCDERVLKANNLVDAAVEANNSCRVDADCVAINLSTDCYGTCSGSVAASGADEVRDAINEANHEHCSGYVDDGCPFMTPECLAVEAVCKAGTCDLEVS